MPAGVQAALGSHPVPTVQIALPEAHTVHVPQADQAAQLSRYASLLLHLPHDSVSKVLPGVRQTTGQFPRPLVLRQRGDPLLDHQNLTRRVHHNAADTNCGTAGLTLQQSG